MWAFLGHSVLPREAAVILRSWDRYFVCPSVCLSGTRVLCDKTKEQTADILIPYERIITLVFWYQQRLMDNVPSHLKFVLKVTHPFEHCQHRLISAYNVWTVRGSEKCSNTVNRKSMTNFPTSYRWSAYVTHNFPKGGSKSEFVVFVNKIQVWSNKVWYKVSLCENFQRQSCSRTIDLSNGE